MRKLLIAALIIVLSMGVAFGADAPATKSSKGVDVFLDLNGFGSMSFADGTDVSKGVYFVGNIPEGTTVAEWLSENGRNSDIKNISNPVPQAGSSFRGWLTKSGKKWDIKNTQIAATKDGTLTLYADWTTTLTRIAGDSRFETSIAVADELLARIEEDKFDAIIIANGENYPDALSGSSLASATGAPIILTDSANEDNTIKYIEDNLAEDGVVYILGGEATVSTSFETTLSKEFSVERFAGADRIATNLQIIRKTADLSDIDKLVLCTAYDYADALAASSTGAIIMLVGGSLTYEQKAFITEHEITEVVAVGGDSAINESVLYDVEFNLGIEPERISGSTRYETSKLLAERFYDSSSELLVANGHSFADGLAGSCLAIASGCPLLLVKEGFTVDATSYAEAANVESVTVIGGSSLVADKVVLSIFEGEVPEKHTQITEDVLNNLDLDGYDKLMIVAHPDDETLWAGCHLAEDNYLVVCLTNGDNKTRSLEFANALTISNDKFIMLEYPDTINGVKNDWSEYSEQIASDIDVLINYKDWDIIVTHNPEGEYGHLHHILTSRILADSNRSNNTFDKLYYFGEYFEEEEMPEDYAPNMSASSMEIQEKMLACYHSQLVYVHRHMKGFEAFIKASEWNNRAQITEKAYRKAIEIVEDTPAIEEEPVIDTEITSEQDA